MPQLDQLQKVPPQSIEAEAALLGSMLLDEGAIAGVIDVIDAGHFYKDGHKKIFEALLRLYEKNQPADVITLAEELRRAGHLEDAEGASYIAALASSVPTAANVLHYAKIVKEKYILRQLIHASTQIVAESYETQEEASALLDRAEQMIFEIASGKVKSDFVAIRDLIKDSIETIDQLYQKKGSITGVPTGFHEFDIKTAGLHPSDLIVIAGRPSMGKSALMSCIAEHAAVVEKIPAAIFSLEMSKEQLVQRMLCSHARVDAHKVRTGFLSQSDWPRLTQAAGKLSEAPIYIDDSSSISLLELRAKARRLKAQHDIQLIILDYLQLMAGPLGVENRQQEISAISRGLKAIAKELNIPLIAISQLSRAPEQRTDRRPQLSDLRESGSIEQDADVVVLLLREEYYNPTEENKGMSELILAKQRNGPTGSLFLTFVKEYTRFENLSKRPGAEA